MYLFVISTFLFLIFSSFSSQFQCRQCQDLLENNLAHKRPIEGADLCRLFSENVSSKNAAYSSGWQKESGSQTHRRQQGRYFFGSSLLAIMAQIKLLTLQGEIVKRILYKNPDAEFIFCAGDDKASFQYLCSFYALCLLSFCSFFSS